MSSFPSFLEREIEIHIGSAILAYARADKVMNVFPNGAVVNILS